MAALTIDQRGIFGIRKITRPIWRFSVKCLPDPLYAGQGVGSLRDLPRAADVVQSLVREAQAVIAGLQQRLRSA